MKNAATFKSVFPPFTQHILRVRSLHILATDLKLIRSVSRKRRDIASWKFYERSCWILKL